MSAASPATTAPPTAARGELVGISYLRGLAALGVVFLHLPVYLWVGLNELHEHPELGGALVHLEAYLSVPTLFMSSGVMLFFVISGFCIHLPYATATGKPLAGKEYAVRRFFRIYPPYLVALVFTVLVEWIGVELGKIPAMNWPVDGAAVFMLQSFLGIQPATNVAMWTLPVEVSYYLLYPLIYFGFRALSVNLTLGVCLLATLGALTLDVVQSTQPGFSFVPYWVVWTSGAVLAEYYASGRLRKPTLAAGVLALLGLAVGCLATCLRHDARAEALTRGAEIVVTFESFGYGCFLVVFLWWSLTHHSVYENLPRGVARCLDFLGTISYSLYLFHIPLFILMAWGWLAVFPHKPIHYLFACCFIAPVILVAWIVYRLVEAPAHEWGRQVARRYKPKTAPKN